NMVLVHADDREEAGVEFHIGPALDQPCLPEIFKPTFGALERVESPVRAVAVPYRGAVHAAGHGQGTIHKHIACEHARSDSGIARVVPAGRQDSDVRIRGRLDSVPIPHIAGDTDGDALTTPTFSHNPEPSIADTANPPVMGCSEYSCSKTLPGLPYT